MERNENSRLVEGNLFSLKSVIYTSTMIFPLIIFAIIHRVYGDPEVPFELLSFLVVGSTSLGAYASKPAIKEYAILYLRQVYHSSPLCLLSLTILKRGRVSPA